LAALVFATQSPYTEKIVLGGNIMGRCIYCGKETVDSYNYIIGRIISWEKIDVDELVLHNDVKDDFQRPIIGEIENKTDFLCKKCIYLKRIIGFCVSLIIFIILICIMGNNDPGLIIVASIIYFYVGARLLAPLINKKRRLGQIQEKLVHYWIDKRNLGTGKVLLLEEQYIEEQEKYNTFQKWIKKTKS
jgi:hypothetical protein